MIFGGRLQSLGEMAGMTGAVAKDALRRRIYLGNIYYEIKEPEIRSVFQPFGTITSVEMSNDPLYVQPPLVDNNFCIYSMIVIV